MTFDPTASVNKRNTKPSNAEQNMRRAYGVDPGGHGHRRRFAQEGDVTVVIRGQRDVNRDAAAAEIQSERIARQSAERMLTAAQTTIRDLQTKLAHCEMALDESRDASRRADERAAVLEAELAERNAAAEMVKPRNARETDMGGSARAGSEGDRRRGRPPVATTPSLRSAPKFAENQEPVDWWSKHEKRK